MFTNESKSIIELPIELQLIIIKFINFSDLLNVKLVCKLWQDLVLKIFGQQKHLLIHDTLYNCPFERCYNFNIYGIQHQKSVYMAKIPKISCNGHQDLDLLAYYRSQVSIIISQFPRLETIFLCLLYGPKYMDVLQLITNSCLSTQLRHVSVISSKHLFLQNIETEKFCQKFPLISVFQFESGSLFVTEMVINKLFKLLPRLEVLILMDAMHSHERSTHVISIGGQELQSCFENMTSTLCILKVSGDMLNRNAIVCIDKRRSYSLQNLHICDVDSLRTTELFIDKFTNLKSLTLSDGSFQSTANDCDLLVESVSQLNQLRKLHLFIESEDCLFTYQSLQKLKRCRLLTTLQMESTTLTGECIESICRALPWLRRLDLTYVRLDDNPDASICWIQILNQLECLKISTTPDLTDCGLKNIIKRCNQLRYLDISRSDLASAQTFLACVLAAISRPTKQLVVYFSHKNQLTIDAVKNVFLENQYPNNLVLKFRKTYFIS